jgi:hypothetical protein
VETIAAPTFLFVIDTDAYSGNFVRELAAAVTGQVAPDDEVGIEEAQALHAAHAEINFDDQDLVDLQHDDDGRLCVGALYPTPGLLNDGMGNHVAAAPGQTGFPAYQSIAIRLTRRPTSEEIAAFKERSRRYAAAPTFRGRRASVATPRPFTVTGFRLIEQVLHSVEAEI